ncbi:MAG: hypothetical protein HQL74_09365 [Magnetococcales bacterium]|nr:hypothetical protein [Magnetococcales bacterium]
MLHQASADGAAASSTIPTEAAKVKALSDFFILNLPFCRLLSDITCQYKHGSG